MKLRRLVKGGAAPREGVRCSPRSADSNSTKRGPPLSVTAAAFCLDDAISRALAPAPRCCTEAALESLRLACHRAPAQGTAATAQHQTQPRGAHWRLRAGGPTRRKGKQAEVRMHGWDPVDERPQQSQSVRRRPWDVDVSSCDPPRGG